jgi:hypothetical protein
MAMCFMSYCAPSRSIVYSSSTQGPLGTDQAKAEARARRTKRFTDALDAIKALVESPQ